MSAEADRIKFVIIGIGINVNASSKELPPGSVSLKEITGKEMPRVEFTRQLLEELEEDYLRLKNGDYEGLAKDWEDFSVTSGHRIRVNLFGRETEGEAVGIDQDGALWIRKDNGLQEKITAGDIQRLRHD